MPQFADFKFESALLREKYDYIIAIDEVGRGAIAGPVVVGATVVDATLEATMPEGIRDSKLIPEKQRASYLEKASQWVLGGAVGRVDAAEVDSFGITNSLATAASRAISHLEEMIPAIKSSRTIILLDGSHNWLEALSLPYFTITKVKADLECASVSAASIFAKVYRDNLMVEKSAEIDDIYNWSSNKGYGAKSHYEAIAKHGVLQGWHRITWINK